MKIGKSKIKKFLTQEIDDEKLEKFFGLRTSG